MSKGRRKGINQTKAMQKKGVGWEALNKRPSLVCEHDWVQANKTAITVWYVCQKCGLEKCE